MATRAASWVARGVTTTTPPIRSAGSSRSEFAPTSEWIHRDPPRRRRVGFPLLTRVTNMKFQAHILAAALGSLACLSYVNTAAAGDHHHQGRLPGEVIAVDIYDPEGLVAHGPQGQLHL